MRSTSHTVVRMAEPRTKPKEPLDHEPDAVAYALDQSGLTKAQLAERCGCSPSLITEIINGTRNATPPMILKLARALNCPRVILERKREPQTTPPADVDMQPVRGGERAEAHDVPEMRRVVAETDPAAERRGA